ncbi:hypothetical protein BS78_03G128500 [Paspalum vaginatum]|nr:hypothetical protein BS78_03G128500 [Paspalum vaginatum]
MTAPPPSLSPTNPEPPTTHIFPPGLRPAPSHDELLPKITRPEAPALAARATRRPAAAPALAARAARRPAAAPVQLPARRDDRRRCLLWLSDETTVSSACSGEAALLWTMLLWLPALRGGLAAVVAHVAPAACTERWFL